MRGRASSEEMIVRIAQKFVGISHDTIAGLRNARTYAKHFVVARGVKIPATDFGYHDEAIIFSFHEFVFETEGTHRFDAADFKPNKVICMVDDAHLIGFAVANAHRSILKFLLRSLPLNQTRIPRRFPR